MATVDDPFCSSSIDRENQKRALAKFESLGGNPLALESALESLGLQARRLRREHDAVFDYVHTKYYSPRLRVELKNLAEIRVAFRKAKMAIPPVVELAEETPRTQLRAWSMWNDPRELARQRNAVDGTKPPYGRIRPPLPKLVNFGGVAVLDYNRTFERADRAIRRQFIPHVVREIYAVMSIIAPTVRRSDVEKYSERWKSEPRDPADRAQIEREVSAVLHQLTSDTVRAFYPTGAMARLKSVFGSR